MITYKGNLIEKQFADENVNLQLKSFLLCFIKVLFIFHILLINKMTTIFRMYTRVR